MPMSAPTTDHHEIRYWAESNRFLPVELKPHSVDHNPAILKVIAAKDAPSHREYRVLTWEEFFLKFDALGLAFVYDDDPTGYNELLQVESRSPYLNPSYRPANTNN